MLVHIVMRHLMDIGDKHLVRVQIHVEGDGTNAVFASWRTEVAQFRSPRMLEMQLEAALAVNFAHHGHRCLGEEAFQQFEFFRFHCF